MPIIPIWLSILIKIAMPIVLQYLQKSGAIDSAEAWGIKTGTHVLAATRVEDSYPKDTALRDSPGN